MGESAELMRRLARSLVPQEMASRDLCLGTAAMSMVLMNWF
jgi:hypothetical protein